VRAIENFLTLVEKQQKRSLPRARFLVLEELPRYVKVRIIINDELFIEVRYNAGNNRKSYVLVRNGKRLAGFDNLGGWHIHPKESPAKHRRVSEPPLEKVFTYFSHMVK
jgi:hypothetical protein